MRLNKRAILPILPLLAVAAILGYKQLVKPDVEVTRRPHYVEVTDNRDVIYQDGRTRQDSIKYVDSDGDGHLNTMVQTVCTAIPGTLGLGKKCKTHTITFSPGVYGEGPRQETRDGTKEEIGLFSVEGQVLDGEFKRLRDGRWKPGTGQ